MSTASLRWGCLLVKKTNKGEALNNRAWSNFYLNHIDLSIKDFSTLIQHGVSKDEAYINRSQCYEKLGLFNEELMDLNQAIKINPSNTKKLNRPFAVKSIIPGIR